MKVHRKITGSLTAALAALTLAGCGASDPLAPFQPQISNATDNFQLQASGVTNLTATLVYDWQNTGTRAKLNPSTTVTAGTAVVTLLAPSGTQTLSSTLTPSGDVISSVGSAGGWTIRLVLTGYSGTMNFRVQKEP